MKRYNVPRLTFINKLDRSGANPWKAISQIREKLRINATPVQIPMGVEKDHEGVIDLLTRQALFFEGPRGWAHFLLKISVDLDDRTAWWCFLIDLYSID